MLPARLVITVLVLWFACPTRAQVTLTDVKVDVAATVKAGNATLTSTPFDIGDVNAVFDGKAGTLARTPNISPSFVQVAFTAPRALRHFRVLPSYGSNYDWWIERADSQADMETKSGSWAIGVAKRNVISGNWGDVSLGSPITAQIWRLWVDRHGGDDYCHLNEWELYADVQIDRIDVTPAKVTAFFGQQLPFHAQGYNLAANESYDVDALASWTVEGNLGPISSSGVLTVQAADRVGGVFATVETLRSASSQVTVAPAPLDLDVLYIERTPRLAFDPNDTTYSSGQPTPGQRMTYLAHVRNWGSETVTMPFEWWLDATLARQGVVSIPGGSEVSVPFEWPWESADHELEFRADPSTTISETSRLNNRVRLRTNALLVGLWVEQGLYDYFRLNQFRLNDGANSFEDWGQRMIRRWNEMFAQAVYPVARNGVLDRVALDKVVVVPNDALPLNGGLPTNNPDNRDRTVDLMWGYPWNPANTNKGDFYGFRWNGPFNIDIGSIHEMDHARFHVDLYALDENHNASSPNVQLRNDSDQLVPGTSLMPFIAFDVVYYNKWRDLMGAGPTFFDAYSAYAWNWKAHQRGQGNQNAPPDLGRFLNDLPDFNHFQFIDQQGAPIVGAEVGVYRATGSFYSKQFDDIVDETHTTDDQGMIHLGRNPFSGTANFYNYLPPILIFKVRHQGQLYFLFQEVTDFNLACAASHEPAGQKNGWYVREIDLRDNATAVPQGSWLGNYFNGDIHTTPVLTRNDGASLDFTWPGTPAPEVSADQFSVYWESAIQFTDGWKQFAVEGDGGLRLYIDGRLLIDEWDNSTPKSWTPVLYTSSSSPFVNPGRSSSNGRFHRVEVRYRHDNGAARAKVTWSDAAVPGEVPVNAWRADYFTTRTLTGYRLSRVEALLDDNFESGSPDPVLEGDNFSARWTGDWDFQAGEYKFIAHWDEAMRASIDGVSVLNKWSGPASSQNFSRTITAGRHRVQVEMNEAGGNARASFYWGIPPAIQQPPASQVAVEGSDVTLRVIATGDPAPAFQWRFNGAPIAGSTSAELTLPAVKLADAGSYSVDVSNIAGSTPVPPAILTVVPEAAVPVIGTAQLESPDSLAFELTGLAGVHYAILASSNLSDWAVVQTLTLEANTTTIRVPVGDSPPSQFFRATVVP